MIILLIKWSRLVRTIQKPDKFVRFLNVLSHSNIEPFYNRTQIEHPNTGMVWYSDDDCIFKWLQNLLYYAKHYKIIFIITNHKTHLYNNKEAYRGLNKNMMSGW